MMREGEEGSGLPSKQGLNVKMRQRGGVFQEWSWGVYLHLRAR